MSKIMRKFLFAFALLAFVFGASAQGGDPVKAKEILKRSSTKFRTYKTVSGEVKVGVTDQKAKVIETQTGTFKLKGNKFRLKLGNQELICNGTTLWTLMSDLNECSKSKYRPKPGDISPTNIFTIYETGFDSYYLKDEANNFVIDLVPLDKKRNFSKIRLYIDKKSNNVNMAKIFEKNGTHYTYTLKNLVVNKNMQDQTFEFIQKNYPKVELIDLGN